MNELTSHKSLTLKGVLLVVFAWVMQLLFLVPMAIWGLYLSEKASPFFSETFVGAVIVYGSYYSFALIPSLLVIFASKILFLKVSNKFVYLQYLQPSLILGALLALSGPGGLLSGVLFASIGYINILIVDMLMKWFNLCCKLERC